MTNDDRKIREKLQQKTWNEIKTNDSWAIFKIMAEFVEGYEKLSKIGPCVSIFGSARTKPGEEYYELSEEVAYKLTQNGYGVLLVVAQVLWKQVTKERIEEKELLLV